VRDAHANRRVRSADPEGRLGRLEGPAEYRPSTLRASVDSQVSIASTLSILPASDALDLGCHERTEIAGDASARAHCLDAQRPPDLVVDIDPRHVLRAGRGVVPCVTSPTTRSFTHCPRWNGR
jgi:hypothetical protein